MSKDPLRYFRVEARELVDQISQGVLDLERGADVQVVARLLRAAHTLKGAARVVRQSTLAEAAHAIEGLLVPHRDGAQEVPRETVNELLRLVDGMLADVERLAAPDATPAAAPAEGAAAPAAEVPDTPAPAEASDIDELLDAIGETHARFGALRGRAATIDRIRRSAELLAERLRRGGNRTDSGQSLAVRLAADVGSLGRQLTDAVEQVERELDEVRGRAERLRLVPAARIFTALHRAVRDVAEAQGKRVAFDGRGGELRLDPHVLSQVGAALLHVVRNAVAHGIEPEQDRRAAGKPAQGYVTVTVERRGRYAAFTCNDDGRGFDLDAVRRAAEASGLTPSPGADTHALLDLVMRGGITTAESVTAVSGRGIGLNAVRDVAEQLGGETSVRTEPGAGTSVEVVVPLSLVALHGLVVRASGATASMPLDAVRCCVRLTADELATATAAAAMPHDGRVIPFLPLHRPLTLPAVSPDGNGNAGGVAVVVNADAGSVAVGVDKLLCTSTLVVRPLPALAPADAVVAGVCVDAEGNPQLVLDTHALVAVAAGSAPREDTVDSTGDATAEPVLVVDDSLTTRMLERSILESAGYEVDTAASGEEGLAKAGQRRYALFLVDIDMPGIDGFTFVERTRADPVLQDTPAILVSSRSSTEDRRRGAAVGASAYMVKSEFNQEELLEHITRLVHR